MLYRTELAFPLMSLWRLIWKQANIRSRIILPSLNLPENCHFRLPILIKIRETIFLYPRLLCLRLAQFQMLRYSVLS